MKRPKIARAMDYLDDDLIEGALRSETKISKKGARTMKNSIWTKVAAVAASLAILVTGGIVVTNYMGVNANAIVALDVNPSIEIEVNSKEKVVGVDALNADADIILGDMNLENVDLDVAINAIIGSMLKNGYLSTDQNSILVSIDCKNASKSEALQDSISKEVTALLAGSNIEASVITQNFEKANTTEQNNDVSAAKAALIEKIVAAGIANADGVPYTYDQLVNLTVNELKQMLEIKGVEVGGIQSLGNAGKGDYIGKQQALDIAFAKAEVTAEQAQRVEIELDYEMGVMVYEVEFDFGEMEYEYEINAKSGELVKEKVEPKDYDDDDDDDDVVAKPENCIGKQAALEAAYAHAGVTADAVRDIDCELESFNGKTYYEVEFEANGNEYEYAVNATTGEIINSKVERDD